MAAIPRKMRANHEREEALKPKKEARPLVEEGLDIVAFISEDGAVMYVSPSIMPVLGYASEEIIGRHTSTLVHPADHDLLYGVVERLRAMPGNNLSTQVRLRNKKGVWRWFEASATNLLHVPTIGAVIGQFRDIERQERAPFVNWSQIYASEHFIQFYENDAYLLNTLSEFIGVGLEEGDGGVVFATRKHLEGLEERLKERGADVEAARKRGSFITWDAHKMLQRFMVDGQIVEKPFVEELKKLIIQAAQGKRHVRVFREMVMMLQPPRDVAAAVKMEVLWNALRPTVPPFSLFCAYPAISVAGGDQDIAFAEICNQHSYVVPDESYTSLGNQRNRLRAITQLQQKAHSLAMEIAERKKAEEQLRGVMESMPQKIFKTDASGAADYFNPQWAEFTGLPLDEILGWGWKRFIHPDDLEETMRLWEQAWDTGEPFYFEHRYRRADGAYLWHVTRALPIHDERGQIYMWLGASTDIDEQKQLEARKNSFISMASHELKTPVTSLKGFTQVLQRRLKKQADPQTLLFLDRMDVQLNKLASLVNELLDISKMEMGTLAFREERVDFDELVRETIQNVQATTTTHQIYLQGETRAQVNGDRGRLEQILVNLLTNAVKYSLRTDEVIVHLAREQHQIKVSVQDFGIGIAEEHHEHLFERFYQVSDAHENTYPGMGLGLYIAHTFVERHGGRLWLESEPGKGSTFHFTLPLPES